MGSKRLAVHAFALHLDSVCLVPLENPDYQSMQLQSSQVQLPLYNAFHPQYDVILNVSVFAMTTSSPSDHQGSLKCLTQTLPGG